MAMAEHAAGIGGIDFNSFGDGGQAKRGPGKKVADDGLQMAVGEPGMGFEGSEPGREFPQARWDEASGSVTLDGTADENG